MWRYWIIFDGAGMCSCLGILDTFGTCCHSNGYVLLPSFHPVVLSNEIVRERNVYEKTAK
jgi:hypothetical protein